MRRSVLVWISTAVSTPDVESLFIKEPTILVPTVLGSKVLSEERLAI